MRADRPTLRRYRGALAALAVLAVAGLCRARGWPFSPLGVWLVVAATLVILNPLAVHAALQDLAALHGAGVVNGRRLVARGHLWRALLRLATALDYLAIGVWALLAPASVGPAVAWGLVGAAGVELARVLLDEWLRRAVNRAIAEEDAA